ncbi:MAG TPA: hypothetical protein VF681_07365 [Abditibacteriaceae bacterium]
MFRFFSRPRALNLFLILLAFVASIQSAAAQESDEAGAPRNTVIVDNFENGVGDWTRNDSIKSANPNASVVLVDLVATSPPPGGVPGSKGVGLFTFKESRASAWASASRRVDGAAWASVGAKRLTFYLNAGGEEQGTELVLRARGANGGETAWTIPVRLNVRSWRRVTIPLADIKNAQGALLPRLKDVYLLQFVQRKTWGSRFFSVDQIQVEGNGVAQKAPVAPTPKPVPTPEAADPNAIAVNVDFLATQGRLRTTANFSVGTSFPSASGEIRNPLVDTKKFREAALTLAPRFIRLDAASLVDLLDSQRPTFDYSRLAAAARTVRSLKAEPLIALANDPVWGLDDRTYAAFCGGAARAVPTARYYELPLGATSTNDAAAVVAYNLARAAIRTANKTARVGGTTATSGRTSAVQALLGKATGLDFLSVQHFGAWADLPSDAALFSAASDVSRLRALAVLLDRSKFRAAPIYLTQANISAARLEGGVLPADPRTVGMLSGAWWASFLATQSRFADAVFHSDAANAEWGLVNERGEAYPAYYALWMWNTYFPAGSARVPVSAPAPLVAIASNAPANRTGRPHNVMLINTSGAEVPVRLGIRGFPILRAVHLRALEDARAGVRLAQLSKSPFQNITLKPYGIVVVQFVEAPKK